MLQFWKLKTYSCLCSFEEKELLKARGRRESVFIFFLKKWCFNIYLCTCFHQNCIAMWRNRATSFWFDYIEMEILTNKFGRWYIWQNVESWNVRITEHDYSNAANGSNVALKSMKQVRRFLCIRVKIIVSSSLSSCPRLISGVFITHKSSICSPIHYVFSPVGTNLR